MKKSKYPKELMQFFLLGTLMAQSEKLYFLDDNVQEVKKQKERVLLAGKNIHKPKTRRSKRKKRV